MWWHRLLTIPHVVRLSRRAPRGPGGPADRWDRFWAAVTTTGDGGDVLWDASGPEEVRHYLELLAAHADRGRPVVDVGCGNGRFTRALAAHFPTALGVDVSPAAVERARLESAGTEPGVVAFRALDVTEPGTGQALRGELGGDAHVFVRGVLHVLDAAERRKAATSIGAVVGDHGVVLIAETNHRGHRLGYLERLGAGPRGIPPALARAISSGIPTPLRFGEAELDDCFPPQRWRRVVVEADATISTVPSGPPGVRGSVPGFVALLSPRPGRSTG